jgi:hypothetical protein
LTCESYDRSLGILQGVGIRETSTVMRKSESLRFSFQRFFINSVFYSRENLFLIQLNAHSCFVQNGDGGFATYELTRSYSWLEVITLTISFIALPHFYI